MPQVLDENEEDLDEEEALEDEDRVRGYHEHICSGCGKFWECDEEYCRLPEATLCLACYDLAFPPRI